MRIAKDIENLIDTILKSSGSPQEKIRLIMPLRGYDTQKKLALRMGVSYSTVSLVIRELRIMISMRKSIARLLKVPYNELWGNNNAGD
tara:strand:+ start:1651 stop:1914 length:264 start_codon:yes stop_codon:yes gene_type:complete